jgi:hypothetical protein
MLQLTVGDVVSITLTEPKRYGPGNVGYPWVSRELIIRESTGMPIHIALHSAEGAADALANLTLEVRDAS